MVEIRRILREKYSESCTQIMSSRTLSYLIDQPKREDITRRHRLTDYATRFFIVRCTYSSCKSHLCLFLGALRSKYAVSGSKYDDFYEKCVRRSLIDFLQSCRRKQRARPSSRQNIHQAQIAGADSSPLLLPAFSPMLSAIT